MDCYDLQNIPNPKFSVERVLETATLRQGHLSNSTISYSSVLWNTAQAKHTGVENRTSPSKKTSVLTAVELNNFAGHSWLHGTIF